MLNFLNRFKKQPPPEENNKPMASSLDIQPKKTTRARAATKKATRQGIPQGITRLLADFRFEHVGRNPRNLEEEVRKEVGRMLIYRTASTPPGSKDGDGPTGHRGIVQPVEFVIMDDKGDWIEQDVAESAGKAEDYGRAFAVRRELEFADARNRPDPTTDK